MTHKKLSLVIYFFVFSTFLFSADQDVKRTRQEPEANAPDTAITHNKKEKSTDKKIYVLKTIDGQVAASFSDPEQLYDLLDDDAEGKKGIPGIEGYIGRFFRLWAYCVTEYDKHFKEGTSPFPNLKEYMLLEIYGTLFEYNYKTKKSKRRKNVVSLDDQSNRLLNFFFVYWPEETFKKNIFQDTRASKNFIKKQLESWRTSFPEDMKNEEVKEFFSKNHFIKIED